MTGEWFPGGARNPDDEAFLAEMRALAARSGLADVEPDATAVVRLPGCLALQVQPPGLPTSGPAPMLELGFDLSEPDPYFIGGWETWAYVLDNAEEIDVAGTERTATLPLPAGRYRGIHLRDRQCPQVPGPTQRRAGPVTASTRAGIFRDMWISSAEARES